MINKRRVMRFLVLGILTLFMISFVPEVVSAANTDIFDPVVEMFADWERGEIAPNVAKYLFTFLVFLLVYAISSVIPFIDDANDWVKAPFALVVAFLGVAYLSTEEIYMMLIGYGAMGLVMGAIIPFIIIVFFSVEIAKKGAGGIIFSQVIWVAFSIFLGYKIVQGFFITEVIGGTEFGIYLAVIILSLLLMWKNKKFYSFFMKLRAKAGMLEHKETLRAANKAGALQRYKEADILEEHGDTEGAEELRKKAKHLERMIGDNY
jgi:hypothetical protein